MCLPQGLGRVSTARASPAPTPAGVLGAALCTRWAFRRVKRNHADDPFCQTQCTVPCRAPRRESPESSLAMTPWSRCDRHPSARCVDEDAEMQRTQVTRSSHSAPERPNQDEDRTLTSVCVRPGTRPTGKILTNKSVRGSRGKGRASEGKSDRLRVAGEGTTGGGQCVQTVLQTSVTYRHRRSLLPPCAAARENAVSLSWNPKRGASGEVPWGGASAGTPAVAVTSLGPPCPWLG